MNIKLQFNQSAQQCQNRVFSKNERCIQKTIGCLQNFIGVFKKRKVFAFCIKMVHLCQKKIRDILATRCPFL